MDLYRLLTLSENVQECQGRKRLHIEGLLNCAYPEIKSPLLSFDSYARRDSTMFFSRTQLNSYFGPYVDELLDCECQDCKAAKNADMDILGVSGMKTRLQNHPWVLGFMIYLGKLHYIYYWVKWDFFNSRGGLKNAILEDDFVEEKLIATELDRSAFQKAYTRAISMFFPEAFPIEENETCPYREVPTSRRFPYSKQEAVSTQGFYGVMAKVEILPEYLDGRIIDLVMERYPSSGADVGADRKLLFALKSVRLKNTASPLQSMERNVLDMVSRIEGPAADNLITLLFAYRWKEQIHFLFPFVEMNLDDVLRQRMCPRDHHSSKLGLEDRLPNHWLWREMKGVCCALSFFHGKMTNPFPNVEGTVIGLHFDLKPANILVTANGKLKITDFGQSIIQILGKGEDMTIPHSPGDSRYAAPESRPTFDYSKNEPEEIEVLLNYDVWSLGCIMVEVLIHMLDRQTLEEFDQALAEEPNAGFSTNADLKECVKSTLESFRQRFTDDAQRQYMVAITELIRRMLSQDVAERPYSWDVFDDLQKEENKLRKLPEQPNVVSPAIKEYELRDGSGFRELGWDNGNSIVSFADMSGITLDLVHQKNFNREGVKPCRIRLFRKSSHRMQAPVEIALVWAVEKGGVVAPDQRKYPTTRWRFTPTYLYRDGTNSNGRFECRLYPVTWPPGQCKNDDRAFFFEFETLQDILTFQGALLQKRILPPIRTVVEGIGPKRSSFFSRERQAPAYNQQTSHIQLWADDEPRYYRPTAPTVNGRRSTATSISSSTVQTRVTGQQNGEQCSTMIIFLQRLSPLVIALNDGHKRFQRTGNSSASCIRVVNRKDEDHDSYSVRQLPAYPAWQSEDMNATPYASSCIILETDYDKIPKEENRDWFKIASMDIRLEKREDLQRFYQGTINEW